jgi:transcriptional regulator with XRE-family HTH domain
MSIKDRLQEIADALGSQKALAAAAGVSSGRVTQWLQGDLKGLSAESAVNIEEQTGFTARWLVTGKLPKKQLPLIAAQQDAAAYVLAPDKEHKNNSMTYENKLVEIVRIFQDTDGIGKDAIWAGARVALKRATRTGKRTPARRALARREASD